MLKWASATFNLFGTENACTEQAFEDLVDLRDFLQEYGRPEKLKEGGWAKRIVDMGPERGISYETCAQLMRDYINPSLDTTISTTGQIVKFFADHPDQWDLIREDASLIPNAVEEAVRMATPIRAYASMPVKVHLAAQVMEDAPAEATSPDDAPWLDVVVGRRSDVATDIIGLELASTDGTPLPAYDAGAHVDVYVKSGLIRQYSLTGDPADRTKYRVGILLDPKSRGGSSAIHADFAQGQQIRIGRPRNDFPMQAGVAHTVLFAGGIGITPMLNMAYALEAADASWELHYCGRTVDRLAFRDELAQFGDRVQVSCQSGVCGTCLTAVAGGMPDHRDLVQTDLEKAANRQITVCCSRSKTKKLVLGI